MNDDMRQSQTGGEESIDAILAEYCRQVDSGEMPERGDFIAKYPHAAKALQSYFETADVVERMAGVLVSESGVAETPFIEDETLALPPGHFQPPPYDAARDSTVQNKQATMVGDPGTSLTGLETLPPVAGDSISEPRPAAKSSQPTSTFPETIGRYQIERILGQGAMGIVYLAHDPGLKRRVALKIPRFNPADGHEFMERFYREARTAANLRSPNICPVYDVGEINGSPFLTMAYIEGKTLSEYIRPQSPQPERQVAGVVRKLAIALAEAHQHGIVHRDLKPANIMIDTKGEPIIMDFGLAREMSGDVEATRLTHFGMMIGTPAYMPPEQVNGENERVGPCSDIYSLGVILYELLTGKIPFQGPLAAVLGQILAVEPAPPSKHRPDLDPRLEAICLKLMSKRIEDRPETMTEVAAMITEYLRTPRPAVAPAAAATPQPQPVREKQKATPKIELDAITRTARRLLAKHDYEQAVQLLEQIPERARNERVLALLAEATELHDETNFLIARLQDALGRNQVGGLEKIVSRLLELKPGNRLGIEARERMVHTAARQQFSLATPMGFDWLPPAVQWITLWFAFFGSMYAIVVIYVKSGDKESKITVTGDNLEIKVEETPNASPQIPKQTLLPRPVTKVARAAAAAPVPRPATSKFSIVPVRQWTGHSGPVTSIAFFPDGERAVSGGRDNTVRIWSIRDGKELHILRHDRRPTSVAVSADGSLFASTHMGGEVNVWKVDTKTSICKIPQTREFIADVKFSPDGKYIVYGGRQHAAIVWDILANREVKRLETGDSGWIHSVEFLPDGRTALAGTTDGRLIHWNIETGKEIRTFRQFPSWIEAIDSSADGSRVLCAGLQAGIPSPNRIWDVSTGNELARFEGHTDLVDGAAFALDERCVVTGSQDKTLRLWDAASGKELARAEAGTHAVHQLAVSPDGRHILTGGGAYAVPDKPETDDRDYALRLWRITESTPAATPKTADSLPAGEGDAIWVLEGHSRSMRDIAISPDGRWIASCGNDDVVFIWDVTTGRKVKRIDGDYQAAVFSSSGLLILGQGLRNERKELRVLRTGEWSELESFPAAGMEVLDLAVTADGTRLLSSHPAKLQLWNVAERRQITPLEKQNDHKTYRTAFDPEGKFVFGSVNHDKVGRWDAKSGRLLKLMDRPRSDYATLSPDGTLFAVPNWNWNNGVEIYSFQSGEKVASIRVRPGSGSLRSAAISPNGKFVISGADNHDVAIANVDTGESIRVLSGHTEAVHFALFSPDSRFAVSGCGDIYNNNSKRYDHGRDNTIRVWRMPPEVSGSEVAAVANAPKLPAPLANTALATRATVLPQPNGTITGAKLRWKLGGETDVLGTRTRFVRFSPDGKYVASIWGNKPPKLIETATGRVFREITTPGTSGALFTPDSKSIVLLNQPDGKLALLDVLSGKTESTSIRIDSSFNDGEFLAEGRLLLNGGPKNGKFVVVNWPSGDARTEIELPNEATTYRQAYTPDGRLIALGVGQSANVTVWNRKDAQKLCDFRAHPAPHWLTCLTFSSDGKTLASSSHEGTVKFWNPETGQASSVLPHGDWLEDLSFSADDRFLAVATHVSGFWIWDVATRNLLHKIPALDLSGSAVSISPDGKFVAVASAAHNGSFRPIPRNPEGYAEIQLWELQHSPAAP